MSGKTRATYQAAWKHWKVCNRTHKYSVRLTYLFKYILFLHKKRLAKSTIQKYVSAVAFHFKSNQKLLTSQHPLILAALKGLNNNASLQASPLTADLLRRFIKRKHNRKHRKTISWAFLLLAFSLLMRPVEYIGITMKKIAFEWVINGKIIRKFSYQRLPKIIPTRMLVKFVPAKRSKKVETTIAIPVNLKSNICPVLAMHQACAKVKNKNADAAFYHGNCKLRKIHISGLTKIITSELHVNGQFSAISLRSGGATSLSLAGAPPLVLKQMGRWHSNAYKCYVRAESHRTWDPAISPSIQMQNAPAAW